MFLGLFDTLLKTSSEFWGLTKHHPDCSRGGSPEPPHAAREADGRVGAGEASRWRLCSRCGPALPLVLFRAEVPTELSRQFQPLIQIDNAGTLTDLPPAPKINSAVVYMERVASVVISHMRDFGFDLRSPVTQCTFLTVSWLDAILNHFLKRIILSPCVLLCFFEVESDHLFILNKLHLHFSVFQSCASCGPPSQIHLPFRPCSSCRH